MSSMEIILFIMVFLLGELWDMETEAMSVTGKLGKSIEIKCSHIIASSKVKYFCKDPCRNEDVLIRSNNKDSIGKYSIRDEGNTFYVTISGLMKNDSGTYWCGIDRVGVDTFNEVILTVTEGEESTIGTTVVVQKPTTTEQPAGEESSIGTTVVVQKPTTTEQSAETLLYIGASLGVLLLALAIILLIFFRHRNRNSSTSPGKFQDTTYATPSIRIQDAHTDVNTSCSTANEDQETDGRTSSNFTSSAAQHQDTSRDHKDNIYSNVSVSSECQIQPDSLFYSTVSFNKDTDCSTVTPHSATTTYSSIRYQSTVYSDV